MGYLVNTILAPFFGKSPNPEGKADCEHKLVESFSTIEKVWLEGDSKFLLGNDQPSIADISFVSEIMQLHVSKQTLIKKHQLQLKSKLILFPFSVRILMV